MPARFTCSGSARSRACWTSWPHRVTTAINGSLGLSLLTSNRYDLVITDFMMPIVDGVELVRTMRADRRLCNVPVMMISAHLDIASALAAGLVQATLRKPFSPTALYAAIDRVTAGANAPAP